METNWNPGLSEASCRRAASPPICEKLNGALGFFVHSPGSQLLIASASISSPPICTSLAPIAHAEAAGWKVSRKAIRLAQFVGDSGEVCRTMLVPSTFVLPSASRVLRGTTTSQHGSIREPPGAAGSATCCPQPSAGDSRTVSSWKYTWPVPLA